MASTFMQSHNAKLLREDIALKRPEGVRGNKEVRLISSCRASLMVLLPTGKLTRISQPRSEIDLEAALEFFYTRIDLGCCRWEPICTGASERELLPRPPQRFFNAITQLFNMFTVSVQAESDVVVTLGGFVVEILLACV